MHQHAYDQNMINFTYKFVWSEIDQILIMSWSWNFEKLPKPTRKNEMILRLPLIRMKWCQNHLSFQSNEMIILSFNFHSNWQHAKSFHFDSTRLIPRRICNIITSKKWSKTIWSHSPMCLLMKWLLTFWSNSSN